MVIGQPDVTSTASSCSRTGLSYPSSVAVAGSRVFVADGNNNRILVYNSIPTGNGAPADVVVGQASMTSVVDGSSDTRMSVPYHVASNGVQLFVSDWGNNRVVVYDSFPTANGAAADTVIGQADFTTNAPATTASTLDGPGGIAVTDSLLVVDDTSNHRVLIYRP